MVSAESVSEEIISCAPTGSYSRVPPIFDNSDVLDLKFKRRYRNLWNTKLANYPELKLYHLKGVRMEDWGYLFFGKDLIEESVLHLSEADIHKIISQYGSSDSQTVEIKERSLILKRRSSSNYGHWLIEFLPWAEIAIRKNVPFQRVILEYYARNKIGVVQSSTLAAVGLESSWIKRCSRTPYLIDDLWIPSKGCIHSHTKHPLLIRVARSAGLSLLNNCEFCELNLGRRLYVSRKENEKRHVVNECSVFNYLEQFGFERVYTSDFTYEEQVWIFSQAEIIVGVGGAALTNIIYSPPTAKVICLLPAESFENFFWDLCCHLDLKYSVVFGRVIDGVGVHGNFLVDLDVLGEALTGV